MTNFDSLKDNIWDSARSGNRDKFDEQCAALVEKARGDWWRIGWSLAPNNLNELYQMLDKVAEKAHEAWLKAMDEGDAPNEDISPGEGFLLVKMIIQDAVNKKGVENDGSRVN